MKTLSLIFFVQLLVFSICINDNKNMNKTDKIENNITLSNMIQSISTILLSGLFDRSFFVVAFMAMKYSKSIVILSASLSLSLVGIFSVFLGVAITKYIPPMYIDLAAIGLFFVFGIKMVLEGVNMKENEHSKEIEEEHKKLICDQEGLPIKISVQNDLNVFFKIFSLIFLSEIGDRSQISTIYLTSNIDKITVIIAVIISQTVLSIIAAFGGKLISSRISEKNLTIIAGSTFVIFGIVALYLFFIEEVFKTGIIEEMNDIIPLKTNLMKYHQVKI